VRFSPGERAQRGWGAARGLCQHAEPRFPSPPSCSALTSPFPGLFEEGNPGLDAAGPHPAPSASTPTIGVSLPAGRAVGPRYCRGRARPPRGFALSAPLCVLARVCCRAARMCPRHQRHSALTFCAPRSLISAFKESRARGYAASSELLLLLAVGD